MNLLNLFNGWLTQIQSELDKRRTEDKRSEVTINTGEEPFLNAKSEDLEVVYLTEEELLTLETNITDFTEAEIIKENYNS